MKTKFLQLRVSMGPKCWFFVYFFFGAPPKKPTLWPRGDKKSKQKPCCVFTNFSNFFYLYEEDFGRHNKQNGISGIVMGEHTRTILSFSETHPPTRFARRGQALRAWPRGRFAAPRGVRKNTYLTEHFYQHHATSTKPLPK